MSSEIFSSTLQLLEAIDGYSTYSMEVRSDEDGYFDKECPNVKCLSKFKVNAEDWDKLFSDDKVHCPFCGRVDTPDDWWTTEQIKQAEQQAVQNLEAQIGQALQEDAGHFNRTTPKSFISMNMKISGFVHAVNLPANALEEMQQKIICEKCGARYAVIGSAFYCPCCGHNSARLTFNNTIEKVKSKINNLETIEAAISAYDKDEAARTCTSLLESSVPELVVAIQRLCECVYIQLPNAQPPRKNIFQRINDGNILWRELCGKGYEDWISGEELRLLEKFFQQRHLLQHREGIIDSEHIDKSGDTSYQVGQRLIIKKKDVLIYTQIAKKLGREIIALLDKLTGGNSSCLLR